MPLRRKQRKVLATLLIGLSTLIYLLDVFKIVEADHFAIQLLFLLAGLLSTSHFGGRLLSYIQVGGERAGTSKNAAPKLFSNNLERLSDNVKNTSDEYIEDVIKAGTTIEYIDVPCFYYPFKDLEKDNKSVLDSALEKLSEGVNLDTNNVILLGEGGAGKTTLIQSLIVRLIEKASFKKVPVFISLSKWKGEQFETWLSSEVKRLYFIDKSFAAEYINRGLVIPFLDGLDEVPSVLRQELVEDLKDYSMSRRVVFSCRKIDFEALSNEFKMEFSICELQPLSTEQIHKALGTLSENNSIRKLASQEFVRTPLILNVVAIVGGELSKSEEEAILKEEDAAKISELIWEKYDSIMFAKKFSITSQDSALLLSEKTQNKLRYWMVWLAKNARNESADFFIERLQPDWIKDNFGKVLYLIFSRVAVALVISVSVGLFLSSPFDFLNLGVMVGTLMGVISLITYYFKRKKVLLEEEKNQKDQALDDRVIIFLFSKKLFLDRMAHIVLLALILGGFTVLYLGFTVPRKPGDLIFNGLFARTESYAGVFITLFFAVVFGLRNQWQTADYDIRPVEQVKHSWSKAFSVGLTGSLSVASFLFICALVIDLFVPESTFGGWLADRDNSFYGLYGPFLGIVASVCFGFPIFLVIGWLNQSEISVDEKDKKGNKKKYFSNYGVKRSGLNALFTGMVSWVFFGGIFGLYMWLYTNSIDGILKGLRAGLGAAIFIALWFGGADFIQHWVLRLVLFLRGYAPFDWKMYLKYGKTLTFLRQSGTNYSFYHRTPKNFIQCI